MASNQTDGLNVIALVSGGKDSFFSLLHCQANGHRIVALANLHPILPQQLSGPHDDTSHTLAATASVAPAASTAISAPGLMSTPAGVLHQGSDKGGRPPAAVVPGHEGGVAGNEMVPEADEDERDLNSFMYQTVGHQVIPLYAEATGIPLYRRAITGGATQHGKDYSHHRTSQTTPAAGHNSGAGGGSVGGASGLDHGREEEAEGAGGDETESMVPLLLAIKKAHPEANALCAGAILSTYQRTRVESVATRLGLTPLAYLWKYPVLPAPPGPADPIAGSDAQLLDDMAAAGVEARIIKVASGGLDDAFLEGGGSAWLSLRDARLEDKGDESGTTGAAGGRVRVPDLLDDKFVGVMNALSLPGTDGPLQSSPDGEVEFPSRPGTLQPPTTERLQQWSFVGSKSDSVEADTHSIVEQVRERLQQQGLPPSALLSATVILRRMADFPAVNSVYGTLFDAPNPPSRVTISCGDAAAANITVHLTVHTALRPNQRQGLHVQSRSYWAPANIGPYSQAISIPVSSLGGSGDLDASSGVRLVSIAGQIPLIPATMALPAGSNNGREDTLPLQLSLSLQHLWRIGIEMDDGEKKKSEMRSKAILASQAWTAAHTPNPTNSDDDDDDDENGPDLWDRRYNPAYMTFASGPNGDGTTSSSSIPSLPDRSVLATPRTPSGEPPAVTPPLFVAEVDALPRAAGVEWHAHLGVARAAEGSVRVRRCASGCPGVAVAQVVVDGSASGSGSGSGFGSGDEDGEGEGGRGGESRGVRFVQTVVAERWGGEEGGRGGGGGVVVHGDVARGALEQLGRAGSSSESSEEVLAVVVSYVDATVLTAGGSEGVGPVVPLCLSDRVSGVGVYQDARNRPASRPRYMGWRKGEPALRGRSNLCTENKKQLPLNSCLLRWV
ncbi:hypothetical protein CHGG_02835 [Chaetomium globosum CBS 148.51]|uniref:Diphthine--ammonia ligase n=1 Tax=Chaetomium globosum (strain ATCC 6205 / CBS 148.51 / DSM 1962 / NBRC 6347 / NRRL 1970) TaxID=306901 RepID=Q2HAB9_CHAGB|nr:uncharacterized protein CHGG_02835 [Chaetomium globosum CBS 148.51]EAQ90900.1 hypothetical protein CHGG_02835 [Chaetomium globosum CBS 148.51]